MRIKVLGCSRGFLEEAYQFLPCAFETIVFLYLPPPRRTNARTQSNITRQCGQLGYPLAFISRGESIQAVGHYFCVDPHR